MLSNLKFSPFKINTTRNTISKLMSVGYRTYGIFKETILKYFKIL